MLVINVNKLLVAMVNVENNMSNLVLVMDGNDVVEAEVNLVLNVVDTVVKDVSSVPVL